MSNTEQMSRQDTFEMLKEYPEAAVVKALEELGCDPNAKFFPTSIVEDVLGMIDGLDLAHQKVLAGTSEVPGNAEATQQEAIIVREMTSLAGEILDARNCSMDSKVLVAVAQAMVAGGRHKAEVLLRIQEKAFVDTLQQGNRQMETSLMRTIANEQKATEQLFSDENIQKIVSRGTVRHDNGGFDVDSFLGEVRSTVQGQKQSQSQRSANAQALANSQQEFDVDSFLDEVWGS